MKEKTYVEDIDRSMYDFRNEEKDAYRVKAVSYTHLTLPTNSLV